ncbi:hypothetical protein [Mucilaginibacter sp. SP1R1]|uniref:hypothetical protein n=1 Tax=Mucilaginibacter sp. SP1R1 TaxID=2723091 RepID=UPI00161D6BCF|nr:hypothetical protein [Mucilaginibacter sp. SP1R1]MBB6152609.1 hypothetical protein [Mucilaginibacter sp. SP1R1]
MTRNIFLTASFLIIILYSLTFENTKMVGFFFYLILPLIFYMFFRDDVSEAILNNKKLIVITFILSVAGIAYDYYDDFPWKALSYSFAGKDIDLSRDWTYDSVERVAGFFRTSYDAATGVILLLILILYRSKNVLLNHILFVITFVCVYITTTKSCLISVALIYVVYMVEFVKYRGRRQIIYWLMTALSCFIVVLPLGLVVNLQIPFLSNESFKDRILNTWPFVINQFTSTFQYILGLGVGSVGTSQELFGNPNLMSTGDNIFLYLYANIGALAFGLFFLVYRRVLNVNHNIFIYLMLYLLSYGITANIVESTLCQLILAIIFFVPFNLVKKDEQLNPAYETSH